MQKAYTVSIIAQVYYFVNRGRKRNAECGMRKKCGMRNAECEIDTPLWGGMGHGVAGEVAMRYPFVISSATKVALSPDVQRTFTFVIRRPTRQVTQYTANGIYYAGRQIIFFGRYRLVTKKTLFGIDIKKSKCYNYTVYICALTCA